MGLVMFPVDDLASSIPAPHLSDLRRLQSAIEAAIPRLTKLDRQHRGLVVLLVCLLLLTIYGVLRFHGGSLQGWRAMLAMLMVSVCFCLMLPWAPYWVDYLYHENLYKERLNESLRMFNLHFDFRSSKLNFIIPSHMMTISSFPAFRNSNLLPAPS
eukprot:GHVS01018055.1.p1 GENE.GHVS01018055.1~~GHVS01018055.1.p1  ORF type:complete len:156 (+),score=6.25 GHVS01018055.1:160-627(+)